MMSYEEAVRVLEEMRSRYHSGFSFRDKEVIERLYETVLSMKFRKTSCADCYRDAYLEVYNYLKKTGKMEERKYKLRRGVLLRPEFGSSEFYSAKSITDEKAEELLQKNPALIESFESYPSDWKERIDKKVRDENRIELNETGKRLYIGDTVSLSTTSYHSVVEKWTSSNAKVATVDDKGVVTALSEGRSTITATTTEGKTGQCAVTVVSRNKK